jgi:hypothetical protein
MLPLAGSQFPTSHDALSEAIVRGLAQYHVSARGVRAEGGDWPLIERLTVDVTGGRVTRDLRLPRGGGVSEGEIRISRIAVEGRPFFFETAPLQLSVTATNAALGLVRAEGGVLLLTLLRATDGMITIATQRSDLEALVHALITPIAAEQGVDIKGARLTLRSRGPRTLDFQVEVTAKMFVMTARATVSGKLEVDDQFNARVSELACAGQGMLATAATAFLRPHLAQIERRTFPLLALPLGEIKLRDISIAAEETVQLTARFAA